MSRSEQPPKASKVVQLHPPIGPDPDMVAMCERLLESAKAGDLAGLAYIATTNDGGTQMQWSGEENLTMLVGAAHELATTLTLASLSTIE